MSAKTDALRETLRREGIDAYIVPSADYHGSEYVADHFKLREYLSGFTGSAGTLILTQESAALFTDGRYHLQARAQLDGGITLYPVGESGVPDWPQYLRETLPASAAIGFDGRTLGAREGLALEEAWGAAALRPELDLAGALWDRSPAKDRPALPASEVTLLDDTCTGESSADKLARLRAAMEGSRANAHLLTALDDIAWLFNFRANDIPYNPLALCYAVVEANRALLFIDSSRLSRPVLEHLRALSVTLRPYGDVYAHAATYGKEDRVLLSSHSVNYALYSTLRQQATIIDRPNPTALFKAVKNDVELSHLRDAHLRDGLALTRFIHWVKGDRPQDTSEYGAAQKMDALRSEKGCLGPSFTTIAAYGPNGAVVHYQPQKDTALPLKSEGFLLLDSGGQYMGGTTDVTRTIALGALTVGQKRHFTLVLQGMLRLGRCAFPQGVCGCHLDALARQPLWEHALDYLHGTGHGIGYMLCVHEPPVSVNWRRTAPADMAPLLPGMVLSDEPGLYFPGAYGIRLENQMAVVRGEASEHGQFLRFETLTLAPIDLDAVLPDMLSDEDRAQLNAYHQRVRSALSPYLNVQERAWLESATHAL